MNHLRQAGFFKELFDTIYQIIDVGGMVGSQSGAEEILIDIGGYMVTMVELTKLSVLNLEDIYGVLKYFSPLYGISQLNQYLQGKGLDDKNPLDYAGDAGDAFRNTAHMQLQLDAMRRKKHPELYAAPTAPTGNAIPGVDDDEVEARGHLRGIHEHVKAIHQEMSERAHAFGGGDLGRIGVTPVEISSYRHGGGVRGALDNLGRAIDDHTEQVAANVARHYLQQGYYRGQA
jgi:hypothetical protein